MPEHSLTFCPQFSVVVPTYNRSNVLLRAIKSVLAQTLSNFELIVVDDGSTDDTKEVLSRINDSRLIYFHQPNSGCSPSRNAGALLAKGTYLTFLDSDDEVRPDWLYHF